MVKCVDSHSWKEMWKTILESPIKQKGYTVVVVDAVIVEAEKDVEKRRRRRRRRRRAVSEAVLEMVFVSGGN